MQKRQELIQKCRRIFSSATEEQQSVEDFLRTPTIVQQDQVIEIVELYKNLALLFANDELTD